MKEVYLLRHGEKDDNQNLSERGKQAARDMRVQLPTFARIISSGIARADLTAHLLTGQEPEIDTRAAYATTSAEISNEIAALASQHGLSFLDAARLHNNPEVLAGVDEQAIALNALVEELLKTMKEGQKALIVSHDLTIAPAMGLRGVAPESIPPLCGYVIGADVRHYPAQP